MLTKSLHTVTAVTRVAMHLDSMTPVELTPTQAADRALRVLGYTPPFKNDDTYARCVASVKKEMSRG